LIRLSFVQGNWTILFAMDKATPHDIAQMRKSYEQAELDESQVRPLPIDQFQAWFDEAVHAQALEPNAMTLATVGEGGRPSTRVVLLKGADARGMVWYTNYESRKGQELAANPHAALQFFWPELERVVRVEGRVERLSEAESDAYYRTRPLGSRIGAWASPQSQVLSSRAELEVSWAAQQAAQGADPVRPPNWGGYRLVPDRWEFWQGRPSRLHDRIVYLAQADGAWLRQRLAP
jgi:pyridoxamine 5'-phosphate oxidase